jgi:hypothetical protein
MSPADVVGLASRTGDVPTPAFVPGATAGRASDAGATPTPAARPALIVTTYVVPLAAGGGGSGPLRVYAGTY